MVFALPAAVSQRRSRACMCDSSGVRRRNTRMWRRFAEGHSCVQRVIAAFKYSLRQMDIFMESSISASSSPLSESFCVCDRYARGISASRDRPATCCWVSASLHAPQSNACFIRSRVSIHCSIVSVSTGMRPHFHGADKDLFSSCPLVNISPCLPTRPHPTDVRTD
jgi:hypothetical protein